MLRGAVKFFNAFKGMCFGYVMSMSCRHPFLIV